MFALLIFLVCMFAALGTGVLAAVSDFRGMVIPNIYSGIIIGAFAIAYSVLWVLGDKNIVFFSLISHLLGVLIVFGLTAALFAFGAIGAADSKLASAYAFWLGLPGLIVFLFYMTLAGGFLAAAALIMKKWKPFRNPPPGSWPARVQAGESKVPYGIAILCGALASFLNLGYLRESVFLAFLQS